MAANLNLPVSNLLETDVLLAVPLRKNIDCQCELPRVASLTATPGCNCQCCTAVILWARINFSPQRARGPAGPPSHRDLHWHWPRHQADSVQVSAKKPKSVAS